MRVELIHIFEAPAQHIAWSKLETILAFVTLKCFFVLLRLSPCINSSSLFCCRGAENLPTILSAGYKVLVFLRRGPAVVVEVAPEPSLFSSNTFSNFSICCKNSQTFALLHSTQKCNSFAPSCMQQSKMQGPGYFLKH